MNDVINEGKHEEPEWPKNLAAAIGLPIKCLIGEEHFKNVLAQG